MTIVIRGMDVAPAFIVQNVIWDVLVVAMLAILSVITVRFRRKLKNYNGSHKRELVAKKVRLAHLYAMALTFTILGIDPSVIYFSGAGYINLAAIHEFSIITLSYVIYVFFSHVDAYFVAYKTFTAPKWIPKVRNTCMILNAAVGHTLLVTHMIVQRRPLRPVVFLWVGTQLLLLGPVLFYIVRRISILMRALDEKCGLKSTQDEDLEREVRKFHRFGITIGALMIFFGAVLLGMFGPNLGDDWNRRYVWTRTGRFEYEVPGDIDWIRWLAFGVVFYLLKVHWLSPKDLEASSLPTGRTGSTTPRGSGVSHPVDTGSFTGSRGQDRVTRTHRASVTASRKHSALYSSSALNSHGTFSETSDEGDNKRLDTKDMLMNSHGALSETSDEGESKKLDTNDVHV